MVPKPNSDSRSRKTIGREAVKMGMNVPITNKNRIALAMLMAISLAGCESASSIERAESQTDHTVIRKCRAHVANLYAKVQDQTRNEYLACLQANGVKL
jgi:hypothetical protein